MSLIPCTQNCLYQKDGLCELEQALSSGVPDRDHPCVNYVPALQDGGQSLSDVPDPDEL